MTSADLATARPDVPPAAAPRPPSAPGPVLRRLAAFAGLPFAGALAPIVLLPLVARIGGPAGWAGIATAQALGTLAATLIMFGWSVSGQAQVAMAAGEDEAAAIYRRSVRARLLLAAVVVPVGTLAFAVGSTTYALATSLMFAASAATGMSFAWYCVGRGRPGWVATYEVVPKVLAVVVAAALLLWTGQLWVYPAALLAATLGGVLAFGRRCVGGDPVRVARAARGTGRVGALRVAWRDSWQRWREGALSVAGGLYASAPLPLAALLTSVDDVAMMASGDRLYRYGLFAVIGLANGLQAWVLAAGPWAGRRQSTTLAAHVGLGLAGLLFLVVAGRWASALVFGEAVAAPVTVVAAYGVAYLAVSVSTPLVRNRLVPAGRSGLVLVSTTVSGVVGLGAMAALGAHLGAAGIAWGFALSEGLNMVILAAVLLRTARQGRRSVRSDGGTT